MSKHVLVIGAGIAGLAAAEELLKLKHQVTIVEARDRVGGRIFTDKTWGKDFPIDLGASFFHGGPKNPLKELAPEHNVKSERFDYDAGWFYDFESNHHSAWDSVFSLYSVACLWVGLYPECLRRFRFGSTGKSVGDIYDAAERTLATLESNRSAFSFQLARSRRGLAETEYASALHELSVENLLLASETDPEGFMFPTGERLAINGMQKLPAGLARKLQINLRHRVTSISYRRGNVEVVTDSNSTKADAAIVTLPIGVLAAGTVTFDPPLPSLYSQALATLDMGLLNKIVLRFKEPFWPVHVPLFLSTPKVDSLCTWFLNLYRFTKKPVLMGFVGGRAAHDVEDISDDQAAGRMIKDLQRIFRKPISYEGPPLVSRWRCDPFARGSYSRLRVGASGHERSMLATPLLDTIFFAGEATHPKDPSTMHGAYRSGQRAARQV